MKRSSSSALVLAACSLTPVVAVNLPAHGAEVEPSRSSPLFFGNFWKLSPTTWSPPRMALSPDGDYIAAFCPARDAVAPTFPSGSHEVSVLKELVVWRVADQKEVVRKPIGRGGNLLWSRKGLMVANSLWRLTVPAGQEMPTLAPVKIFTALSDNATYRTLNVEGDLALEQFNRKPKLEAALEQKRPPVQDTTPYSLHAFRLSSGTELALAPRIMWRLQNLPPDAEVPPSIEDKQMVLEPVPVAGKVRVVVSREALSDDNIFDIRSGSAARYAQISAWDLVAGRRLWQWSTRFRHFEPDLLWSPDGRKVAVIGTLSLEPSLLQRSPNTKMEDAKLEELPVGKLGSNGIQILDAATGRLLSSFSALRMGGLRPEHCNWSGPDFLVVNDWKWIPQSAGPFDKQRMLRFFNASDGREVKSWDTTRQWSLEGIDDASAERWSIRDDQRLLALATVNEGLRIFKESDFGPLSSPVTP